MKKLVTGLIISYIISSPVLAANQPGKFYAGASINMMQSQDVFSKFLKTVSENKTLVAKIIDQAGENEEVSKFLKEVNLVDKTSSKFTPFIEFGYNLNSKIRMDVSLHHFQLSLTEQIDSSEEDEFSEGMQEVRLVRQYQINNIFLNGYYNIYEMRKFDIFMHAGVGIAKIISTGTAELNTKEESTETPKIEVSSFISMAWKMGLGAAYEINSKLTAQIRYEYSHLDRFVITSSTFKPGISSHNLALGIRFQI